MQTSAVNHRYCGWRESTKLVPQAKTTVTDVAALETRLQASRLDYESTYPDLLAQMLLMKAVVANSTGLVQSISPFTSIKDLGVRPSDHDLVLGINTIQSARMLIAYLQKNI